MCMLTLHVCPRNIRAHVRAADRGVRQGTGAQEDGGGQPQDARAAGVKCIFDMYDMYDMCTYAHTHSRNVRRV